MSDLIHDSLDKRNFLFFLNEIYPMTTLDNSLIGRLTNKSSWDAIAETIKTARENDPLARSIKKVNIYVHVPFCARLCTFCYCPHVFLRRRSDTENFVAALKKQMDFFAPVYSGMHAEKICFGGGTPSVLDEQQLTTILDAADKAFPVQQRKILIEVNPSSWTSSKLAALSSRGLHRLSIGVQSLDEKVLKEVSRPQTLKKVLWSLRSARKAGVPYVNADFIAGLPGQTLKGLMSDLKVIIGEGANIVHVQPYSGLSWEQLCAPGETVPVFLKRRDAMVKAAMEILEKAGFHQTGLLDTYARDKSGDGHYYEEAYSYHESAIAAFGPFAKGQFPGAIFYRAGQSNGDSFSVESAVQDSNYVMAAYAVHAIINGLNEQVFFDRFGISLEQQCGEGLRYLQEAGLVSYSKGTWKFSGKWEIRRIYEYFSLSRILFGEDILSGLRKRYSNKYNPAQNYNGGNSLLKAYKNDWLMALHYQRGIKKSPTVSSSLMGERID
jgi:coproporphyrinogen III oxidase-like Fe-S oxidoreductase